MIRSIERADGGADRHHPGRAALLAAAMSNAVRLEGGALSR
jgi:hypothetical protein